MPQNFTQHLVDKLKFEGKRKIVTDGACRGLILDIRESGKSFRYRFVQEDGTYRAITLGDASVLKLAEARDKVQEIKRQRLTRQGQFAPPQVIVPLYEDFVRQRYIPHSMLVRRAAKNDMSLFKNHLFPFFGQKRLDEISRSDIAEFMQLKRGEGFMASTCNRLLARLKATLSYATEIEVAGFDKNPARGYRQFKEPPHKDRYLSPEEAERLLIAVQKSDSPFLQFIVPFLLLTGARKSEVLNAQWQDIDWAAKRWTIPMTKNGKPRHVPLSAGALSTLQMAQNKAQTLGLSSRYIFPNPATGEPYTSIYYPWHVARSNAGLEDVRMHDLRHSFASALVNRGMTLYDVKEVLGHSNITTTQRYAHLSPQRLNDVVSQADAHYRLPGQSVLPVDLPMAILPTSGMVAQIENTTSEPIYDSQIHFDQPKRFGSCPGVN